MTRPIYLDWNATAPLRPEARNAMVGALDVTGNPSSVHSAGRAARRLVERAREQVAALVGAEPRCVTFTSGGTEANALALAPRGPGDRLLVSAIEHPSVLAGGRFAPEQVEVIPVNSAGQVDLPELSDRLRAGGPALVSVMLANNETGVVQAIPEIARTVHEAGGLLHVDAVQALGRMPFDISELGCDLLTVSAHKIGGPKGIGALIRRDEALQVLALIRGGGQERSLRAGTENVAGIAGFGAAAEAVRLGMAADIEHMRALQERLETGIASGTPDAVIFGTAADRLPNTTLVALPGVKAETAVIAFDLEGVAVSSGAACSSGKVAPSHVLEAMQVAPELTRGAIRISLGPATTEEEIQAFLKTWGKLAGTLYKNRPIAA